MDLGDIATTYNANREVNTRMVLATQRYQGDRVIAGTNYKLTFRLMYVPSVVLPQGEEYGWPPPNGDADTLDGPCGLIAEILGVGGFGDPRTFHAFAVLNVSP